MRAASKYIPADAEFKVLDIGNLPLYNEDLKIDGMLLAPSPCGDISTPGVLPQIPFKVPDFEADSRCATGVDPPEVQQLRLELQQADAILISTCQYNFTISPALKNAIDWASVGVNEWEDKPVAIMAAGGGSGGNLAYAGLQTILISLYVQLVIKPRVCIKIRDEPNHFDFSEALPELSTSSPWQRKIKGLVETLVQNATQIKAAKASQLHSSPQAMPK